jgi:hypothetical protein
LEEKISAYIVDKSGRKVFKSFKDQKEMEDYSEKNKDITIEIKDNKFESKIKAEHFQMKDMFESKLAIKMLAQKYDVFPAYIEQIVGPKYMAESISKVDMALDFLTTLNANLLDGKGSFMQVNNKAEDKNIVGADWNSDLDKFVSSDYKFIVFLAKGADPAYYITYKLKGVNFRAKGSGLKEFEKDVIAIKKSFDEISKVNI